MRKRAEFWDTSPAYEGRKVSRETGYRQSCLCSFMGAQEGGIGLCNMHPQIIPPISKVDHGHP